MPSLPDFSRLGDLSVAFWGLGNSVMVTKYWGSGALVCR